MTFDERPPMNATAAQVEFPFASLDFPGRGGLRPKTIAKKLGISEDQVIKLYDEGEFDCGLDLSSRNTKSGRQWLLIPLESYRNFILSRMNGAPQKAIELIINLPVNTLIELNKEISQTLKEKGHAA